MLGLGSSLLQGGALRSIVKSGLQLFYKADRTQAPLGEEQVRNNSFDEISSNLVSNPTFDLGSEEVQNRTFDLGSETAQNGGFNELGSDEIVNGNFETGISGWGAHVDGQNTITYNSTLKGIKLTKVGSGSCKVSHNGSSVTQGETYKLTYKVLENNNCTGIQVWNGGGYEGGSVLNVNANGEDFVYYLKVTGGGSLNLFFENNTANSDITLSNIRLEQVDPNDRWTLYPGWTIGNNKLNGTSATTENSQTIFASNSSRMLKITYDLVVGSGSVAVYMADKSKNFISQSGSYTDYITSEHTDIRIDGRDAEPFTGSVTNVSVKEIPNWTVGTKWTIDNNAARLVSNSSVPSGLIQSSVFEVGKTYNLIFDATVTQGSAKVEDASGGTLLSIDETKTYNLTFVAGRTDLYFNRDAHNSDVTISNVSVKEVPNWVLGDGWSVGDNDKLTRTVQTGSTSAYQNMSFVSGKSYSITYTLDVSAGQMKIRLGGGGDTSETTSRGSSGTYTELVTANANHTTLNLRAVAGDFAGSISNVSVKQLDPNNRWLVSGATPTNYVSISQNGAHFVTDSTEIPDPIVALTPSEVDVISGRKYRIVAEIKDYVSGSLKIDSGYIPIPKPVFDDNGVFTHDFTAASSSSGAFSMYRNSHNVDLVISSFSVKEITNSIKDNSKNSNDGILYSGKALDFDGAGDGVQLNTAHDISILGDYTIALWFKRNNTSNSNNTIYHNSKDSDNRTGVHWTTENKITFNTYRAATNYQGINSPVLDKDKWYRVISVLKSGVKTLYINNENNPTSGGSIGSFIPSDNEFLGGENEDYYCDGAVADFQLYDKAWNATDVKYDWENPDKDVFDRVDEAEVLGEELVSDADFTGTDSFWTEETNITILGGKAVFNTGSDNFGLVRSNLTTDGKTYKAQLEITDYTSGAVQFNYNGEFIGSFNTVGTHTAYFVAGGNNGFGIQSNGAADLSLGSASLKEVTTHASHILPTDCKSLLRLNEGAGDRVYDAAPVLRDEEVQNGTFNLGSEEVVDGSINSISNWNFGDGWSYVDGKASLVQVGSPQANDYLKQELTGLVNGRNYIVGFDLDISTSGQYIGISAGGAFGDLSASVRFYSTSGRKTFTAVYDSSHESGIKELRFGGGAGAAYTIDNVSVKEVPNWTLINNTTIVNGVANVIAGGDVGSTTYNWSLKSYNNVFQVNKTYRIKFRAKQVSLAGSNAGAFQLGYAYYALFDQVITNEFVDYEFVATTLTSGSILNLTAGGRTAGDVFQIDDISVKEIKPAESFAIVGTKAFIHQQPYIPQYAMSSFSKKMFFDGVNDYVTGSFNSNIGPAKDMTFSCWFNYEDVPTSETRESLFALASSAGDTDPFKKFEVDIVEGNKVIVFTGDGSAYSNSTSTINSLTVNKLNHIAVSVNDYDASNGVIRIYINGVLDTTKTKPYYGASNVGYYRIGTRVNSGSQLYKGIVDEVSLFKSELTQAEVLELYNSGSSFDTTGHSKYNLGEEVSNGTLDLGSEEVENGDFSNSGVGDFTAIEGGLTQVSNELILTTTTTADNQINYNIPLVVGKTYKATLLFNEVGSSTNKWALYSGGYLNGADNREVQAYGVHTVTFVATNTTLSIQTYGAGAIATYSFDNISVKEIPDWSFGEGWSYVDGKASLVHVSTTEYLSQELTGLVDGRTYVISFDLDISSSSTSIGVSSTGAFGDASGSNRFHSTNGRKTFTAVYNSSHQSGIKELRFVGTSGAAFTIDNVSVQEYGVSGYWRNNGADQWDDLSIGSSHGTVSGSPTEIFLQEVPFFGKDSLGMFMNKPRLGGLNFHTSGYVNIEDNNDLDFGTGAFTMECWATAKYESQGSSINVILSLGGDGAGSSSAALVSHSTNKLGGYVGGSTLDADSAFTIGDWYHIAIARDGNGLCTLYIDSEAQSDTETNQGNITNSDVKFIGRSGLNANRDYNGIIDDVKLYNKALTPAEIKKNYNATKGKHKN